MKKRPFFGRSHVCEMTKITEALDDNGYGGNCLHLDIGEAKYTALKGRHVHISGYEIFEYVSPGILVGFISVIVSNKLPYSIAFGKI